MLEEQYVFGVDVGGTTVKLGLFRTDGTLIRKWEIPTRTENHGASILPDVAQALQDCIAQEGLRQEDLRGAGVGVPGPVDAKGFVSVCVNIGWKDVALSDTLSRLLGLRVCAGNDANVAALGEMWCGGGKGLHSIVLVTLGTGIGGGVVINDRVVTGAHGSGGEIGHMTMRQDETEACNCGNHGCLEQYASATGIARQTKKLLQQTDAPSSLRTYETLTAKAVIDEAKKGDTLALQAVEQMADMLGHALASVACVADPEAFIIGGGVSKGGAIVIDAITAAYRKYAFVATKEAAFRLATLGNDAGIYGAARLLL